MMKTPRTHRTASSRLRNCGGFTVVELMIVVGISIAVILSIVVAQVGTIRSWNGTAALLDIQREGSLGVEAIQNAVRPSGALAAVPGAFGDSLEIYWEMPGGAPDSLANKFYLDGNRNLLDINGTVVASHVDSVDFFFSGCTLHIDAWLSSDVNTPNRTTDDQRIQVSSTAICRN